MPHALHHTPSFVERKKKRSRQRTRKKRKGWMVQDAAYGTLSGRCKPASHTKLCWEGEEHTEEVEEEVKAKDEEEEEGAKGLGRSWRNTVRMLQALQHTQRSSEKEVYRQEIKEHFETEDAEE